VINGVAIVHITREKMSGQIIKRRYTFFIGSEALDAIKEYKPNLKDEEFVFTQRGSDKPLTAQEVDKWFAIHAEKCGFDRAYFAPHRLGRHYFKTVLEGNMTHTFIEFLMGHKLPGAESNYLLFKDKMLEEYIKCQPLLTVFTPHEILLKEYDKLKEKHENALSAETNDLRTVADTQYQEIQQLKDQMKSMDKWMKNLISQLPPELIQKVKVE